VRMRTPAGYSGGSFRASRQGRIFPTIRDWAGCRNFAPRSGAYGSKRGSRDRSSNPPHGFVRFIRHQQTGARPRSRPRFFFGTPTAGSRALEWIQVEDCGAHLRGAAGRPATALPGMARATLTGAYYDYREPLAVRNRGRPWSQQGRPGQTRVLAAEGPICAGSGPSF